MNTVYITQDSSLGKLCGTLADLPEGWRLVSSPEACDVYISCFSKRILKTDFLKGRRCYNFHLGLLPKYGGVGICAWVILNGETETGITLHEMDEGIDTGKIISVSKTRITREDTAITIFDRCEQLAFRLFQSYLGRLLLGDYEALPQQVTPFRYTRKMLEEAKDVTRFYKAFSFNGKEKAYYINHNGEKNYLE